MTGERNERDSEQRKSIGHTNGFLKVSSRHSTACLEPTEAADRAGPALAPMRRPVANVSPEHRNQWDIEKSGSLGRSSMLRGSTAKKRIGASLLSCNSPPSRVRRPAIP